jgi:site-specific DNA-cytosine methylase
MPFRLLDEEPKKLETEITPQQTPRIGSFRLLEDEPAFAQSSQPAYKYDASRFRPKGLTSTKSTQEAPEEQSIFRQVADIPLGIARGGVTGIKMMTDILGADNPVSKSLAGVEGYMADLMSAQAKEDQQEISRIMKDAEDKGFGEQVKAGIKAFSIAPVDIMSQALGTMAPVLATGLAGSAAKLGALGIRAVQTGVGAGMGAGMIKGEIYNEVKNELINSGTPEELAEKAAVEAQSYGGKNLDQILLGAGLGAASTLGAEQILTRLITKQGVAPSAGIISRTLKGGFTEAIPEGVQAAQEQLAKNVALQREGFDVDPSRGVVAAATMEAIAGAPLGGLAGAVEQPAKVKTLEEEKFEQTNEIARNAAENGAPLTASALQDKAAANLNQDELARKLEEELSISAVKPSVAAPIAIPTKDEYVARYSAIAQAAPEELTRAEQSFTNELTTADTEEKRINAQNALDAIKEVKAAAAAQPPTTYATQEIIQQQGVREEPQDRTQVGATTETGVSDSILDATRSKEERQVARDIVSELQAVANNTATGEQIARLSMEGLVDVRRGQAIINEDGEGILAQAQAPLPKLTPEARAAEVETAPATPTPSELIIGEKPQVSPIVGEQVAEATPAEPTVKESLTVQPAQAAPVAAPVEQVVTPPVEVAPTIAEAAPVEPIALAPETAAVDRYTELSRNPKIGTAKERKALEPTVATTTFKTSRGSTYYILPDGKIRRDKYSGTTSYSDQIAFVSPENAEKIKEIRNEYEEGKNTSVEITPEVIRFRFNEKIAEVPIASQSPQEGLSPFELSGGRYPHLGDPVVSPAPVTEQAAPAEAPAPEGAPAPQVEQEIEVGDEASVNLAGRNETVTIARIEDINGVPTAYFDYFGYKSRPLAEMQLVKKSKQNIAKAERKAKEAKASQIEITPPKPEDFFSNEEIASLVSGKAPDGWKSDTSTRDDFFLTDTNGKRWSFKPQYENGEITSILMRAEGQVTGVTITKAPTPAVSEAPTQPEGIAVGNRIKLGKSPQTYTIEEVIPQTATERDLGEQYYSVKNERTGEVQVVEAMDMKKVGGKRARKMAISDGTISYNQLPSNIQKEADFVPNKESTLWKLEQVSVEDLMENSPAGMTGDISEIEGYDIDSLIKSIRKDGVKQPIVMVRNADGSIDIEGNHRVYAAYEAGLDTIPAYVLQKQGILKQAVEEKISKTALIDKDGSIISAPDKNHAMLMEESQFNLDAGEYPPMENYGFVTNFGRFVGQKEAQEIARNSQQVIGGQQISGELVTAINEEESANILRLNVQGASGNKFNEAGFKRFPGIAVTRTNSETLTSHPLYNAAKRFNNVEAAKIIVDEFVDDQMVFDVFTNIDPNKPAYIVPVLKGEADSMNMLPVALAEKLSNASGVPVWGNLIQATSEQSTGAGVNEKTEISRQFMGEAPPAGSQIIIVDDYLATGRTIASLENMTGTASSVATIASGRYGNQYGLTTQRAEKLLEKAGITRERFYEIYGLQPEQAITGIEAQAYILNGAAGEGGLTSRFPVEKISPSNEGIKNIANVPESVVLFAGGGLTELGLVGIVRNGYVVEANQRIAEFYEEAHGVPVIQDYVQNVKFYGINGGHLHASPVCKNFSTAKNKQQVTEQDKIIDREAAGAVAQAIRDIQPNTVSIENVTGYKDTESYNSIISALEENGYIYDANFYNANDFGAPTSRKRLIVRAVKKGGVLPEIRKKKKRMSWYDAVKDIVNDLPDHDINAARYPARMMSYLAAKGIDIYNVDQPLLISGTDGKTFRNADQPAMTFLATPRALNIIALPGGIIKKVTARAMARMTGVPDSFPLPADEALAKTIIGNGIPPALTRSVIGDLIQKNEKPEVAVPKVAAEKNQYTFDAAEKEVTNFFGEMPEGIVIVNNTTDPDLQFKAGYDVKTGEIIINLAYIDKKENIGDIISHELGHYIFGDPQFRADFQEFWDMMTPEEQAEADRIINQFYNNETNETKIEEKQIRAFMQLISDSKAQPQWKQLLDSIKRWMNKYFGTKFQTTDRTALAILSTAMNRFASGERIIREIDSGVLKMAAEPKREKVAGKERGEIITTPEGIIKQTQEVLRNKFFDGTEVSDNATQQAWNYIEQLLDIKSGAANALAGQINDVVDQETNSDSRMGASLFSVSLANYAAKLAAQGDMTMLPYIIRRINRMPVDNLAGGRSEAGEALRAAREYQIDGFNTLKTEDKAKVERTAATLFGTDKPSKDQVKVVEDAIKASEDETIGNPEDVAAEIEKVENRTGRRVVDKVEGKIKESTEPKKEELLISFENLDADKKIKGITLKYSPQKVNVVKNIQNLIIGKMVDYRKALVNQGAGGLESTFWQTMSSLENKPGPLGEIDQAQNNELARIVKNTLIKLGLQGEPKNTKMTDIEKVASILNENKLSDEKRLEADQRIVQEIERRRQSELASGSSPEAVNAKYDVILDAWNEAMSRQLNMPISDNMLQRLLKSEIKQRNTQISELINENDGRVVEEVKNDIVDSIIRRIYGVSKESETGIEMDEDYSNLQSYLKQTINNMYATAIQKKNAAYAKRQAERSLKNNVDAQAQSIINQLSTELSDTPSFSPQIENKVKVIVQQDLRQNPNMGRKQPWTSQLTAKLIDAGVDETQAQTISELTWRQHEIKKMDRDLKELKTAAEKGSLAVIIDRIKTTPLEKQQEPNWMQGVIREYLVEAGLSDKAAETAAKLYESVISEKFAEAKQKAFETTLNKSAPWQNYLSRNSRLGKDALKRIQDAIRTGVLDPTQNVESIIARENGWSGFTKEQFQRIVQLDNVISSPDTDQVTKAEAMDELNKIIVKAKIPVRFKDAIGAYYVGQALMGIPTLTVNIASPIGFSVRNLITDIGRYAFTEPSRIPMAFETFLDSMKSWYNQSSYAFRNQIYMNDVVEYLNGQNVLRELFDKGKAQWAKGEYANGMANMLVGMTQITGRVLSALDQGAISMLENQNITRYAMEAMKQRNIPQSKRKEIANMIFDTRRRTYAENVAAGMEKDRAGVLADLAVRSEIINALSPEGIDFKDVLDSAINDSLQSVGRNKTINVDGIVKENERLSDAGVLSYLPIEFLQKIASGAASSGPLMQVFSKMVYGFALVPARVFHTTAWYSPYGFIRLGIDAYKKNKGEDSPYAMSLQTDLQYKQRLTDAIAGSIVMLGLAALASGSADDDEEKKFKIVITGNGPSYSADRQFFDAWHKKYKPYSINIVMGDTVIPINIGRGGEALFFPIMLAGALDDWGIKKKLNLTKKEPEDLNLAVEVLGSSFFALAQRGPYAAFTKPLFDASKEGKITEELVSQAGFFGKTFVPILGSSLSRNISDFINDPIDRSSLEGAIYANTPIVGPWMGAKALNALGQPIRADDWGDRLFKLGVPVVFSFPKNTPENELNELILQKGSGPSIPTRANAQKRFGDVLTDKEFETYVREYGRVVSDKMFKNRKQLEKMSVKDYDDELQRYVTGYSIDGIKITGASDMAVRAVRRMRGE